MPPRANSGERARSAWYSVQRARACRRRHDDLLLKLAGGFLASALGQAAYLFVVARWFDTDDPPDQKGRRQSTNAFVVYSAATAFVLWAAAKGRLVSWQDVPWPVLAGAGSAVAAYAAYMIWLLARPLRSGRSDA